MPEALTTSANRPSSPLSNPHRARDLILVACSFAVAIAAVWYRHEGFALGLDLLAAALFWLAVLDSARSGPRRSRVMLTVAWTFLIGITVIVVMVAVLVMMPRPSAREPATPAPLTVPIAPPPSPARSGSNP